MNKKSAADSLPDYLSKFSLNNPSSLMKLESVWDDLSTENQLQLFHKLHDERAYYDLKKKFYIKVLESKKPYLRYLAAKSMEYVVPEEEWPTIKEKIESDSSSLVKYSLIEGGFHDGTSLYPKAGPPKKFFQLSQEARLSVIRGNRSAEAVVNLIKYALENLIPNGELTEDELRDILLDYVTNPVFQKHYDEEERYDVDGYSEYLRGKEVKSLWEIIPDMPDICASVLLQNLPTGAGFESDIYEKILAKLKDWQISLLLQREDLGCPKIRKKLFFDKTLSEDIRQDAVYYNFDLKFEDFAEILKYEPEERKKYLKMLEYAYGLNLCIRYASYDIIEKESQDYVSHRPVRNFFERRKAELSEYWWDEQITQVRLYELAKKVVPIDEKEEPQSLPEELKDLESGIVKNDTWQTFMNFNNLWHSLTRRLANPVSPTHLPKINYNLRVDDDEKPPKDQITDSKIEDTQKRLHLLNRKINIIVSIAFYIRVALEAFMTAFMAAGLIYVFSEKVRLSVGAALVTGCIIAFTESRKWQKELKVETECQKRLRECKTEQLGPPD